SANRRRPPSSPAPPAAAARAPTAQCCKRRAGRGARAGASAWRPPGFEEGASLATRRARNPQTALRCERGAAGSRADVRRAGEDWPRAERAWVPAAIGEAAADALARGLPATEVWSLLLD